MGGCRGGGPGFGLVGVGVGVLCGLCGVVECGVCGGIGGCGSFALVVMGGWVVGVGGGVVCVGCLWGSG